MDSYSNSMIFIFILILIPKLGIVYCYSNSFLILITTITNNYRYTV